MKSSLTEHGYGFSTANTIGFASCSLQESRIAAPLYLAVQICEADTWYMYFVSSDFHLSVVKLNPNTSDNTDHGQRQTFVPSGFKTERSNSQGHSCVPGNCLIDGLYHLHSVGLTRKFWANGKRPDKSIIEQFSVECRK